MVAWSDAAALKARPNMGTLTDDQATAAVAAASELLDQLTMRQFGIRDDVVRPEGCGRRDVGAPSERATVGWGLSQPLARMVGPWPLPGPYGGMVDYCGSCGAVWHTAVTLQRPVVAASEVLLDGQAFTDFQVYDDALLLRTDGKVWPACQNPRLAPTEAGTFQVSYSYGVPVPGFGVQAALTLAGELAKWWGWVAGECQLPKRITSISRQGVTMAVVDPMDIVKSGGTGLPDVDLFVAGVMKGPRRARIATPGVSSGLHRRTI